MHTAIKTLALSLITLGTLTACQPNQSTTPEAADSATSTNNAASLATTPANTTGFQGTDIRKDDIGGDFTLTDGTGKPFTLSSLKGKAVIISFGYTHCPDVCPSELLTYNDTLKQLSEQSKDVVVVFVSVDPERDTPQVIGQYVQQFNPNFIGLTATQGQNLSEVKQQYRIVSAKAQQESKYVYIVDHTAGAYLIDKNGEVAVFEPYGAEATQIAHDLKILLQ